MPKNILKVFEYVQAGKVVTLTLTQCWYNLSCHSTINMTHFQTLFSYPPPNRKMIKKIIQMMDQLHFQKLMTNHLYSQKSTKRLLKNQSKSISCLKNHLPTFFPTNKHLKKTLDIRINPLIGSNNPKINKNPKIKSNL